MPTRAADLETRLFATDRDYNRTLSDAERRAEKFVSKVNSSFSRVGEVGGGGIGRGVLPALSNISNIISAIPQVGQLAGALIGPLKNATEEGIRFNMMLETAAIGFETMLGSAEKAQAHLKALETFARRTPFQFEDLITASRRMQAFGFASEQVIPILQDVGDALSASGEISGEAFNSVIRSLGQIRSTGRVQADEMNELANRGIPAWEMLAKAIGKTVDQTRKLGEQGRLRGPQAVDAMLAMMRGRFGGQMERVSGTLTGRLSNLEDIQAQAQGLATKGLTQDLSAVIGAALKREDLATSMASGINTAIAPVSGLLRGAIVATVGGGLSEGFTEAFRAAKALLPDGVIKEFAQEGVINPLKRWFGIQSPSTVTFEMGLMLAAGLQEGLAAGLRVHNPLSDEIEAIIAEAAARFGLDPNLLRAMIRQESGGNPRARSPKGARGIAQFMPDTARAYGLRVGGGVDERLDPAKAIPAMAEHVADLLKQFGGSIPHALAGYNAGAGAVVKYGGVPPYRETQNYVRVITRALQEMAGLGEPISEYEQAKRDLAASTNWRKRGETQNNGLNLSSLSPEQQFRALMQIPGFAAAYQQHYGQTSHLPGSRDLTGGIGEFITGGAGLPTFDIFRGAGSMIPQSGVEGIRASSDPRAATFELLKALGQIGPEATASFGEAETAAGSFADSVIVTSEKTQDYWGDMWEGFRESGRDAFMGMFLDGENFFQNLLRGFHYTLAQMASEFLSTSLFGNRATGQEGFIQRGVSALGGWLGFGGGKASGGNIYPGSYYRVHQDEFITPLVPSRVHTARESQGMAMPIINVAIGDRQIREMNDQISYSTQSRMRTTLRARRDRRRNQLRFA